VLLYLGWAFQNGFFWQTVLAGQQAAAGVVSVSERSVPSAAGAHAA
jgi:hypothetical protein